jgi:5-(carboxyamino)imidazole ribonucleotide synthase
MVRSQGWIKPVDGSPPGVGTELLDPLNGFPVVGMIGGGQLARMTGQSAISLGIGFRVLAASSSDSASRAVREVAVGDPDDPVVAAEFASSCDVVTFDHEQVSPTVLAAMSSAGATLRPQPESLVYAQDKIAMRELLSRAGLPCPRWRVVDNSLEASEFAALLGGDLVLKLSRGGYDGRGVWVCSNETEISEVMELELPAGVRWLAEEKVHFTQELAAVAARSQSGQALAYPVVRTVQNDGMCTEVISPAPGLAEDHAEAAQEIALQIAELISAVGVLAVEMFDTTDGVLINELAMRPHNSGHWSIDGAVTSQFENHLRAVLDLPLGDTSSRQEWTVMVNLVGGTHTDLYAGVERALTDDPELKVHMYAKEVRAGRKLGHVTACGDELSTLLSRAHNAADEITGANHDRLA